MSAALSAIDFDRATELLRDQKRVLIELKSNTGNEFFILGCGRVTKTTARKLLEHPDCREVDPGLLPGHAQSWEFRSVKELGRRPPKAA
jgi:hypothetical protein